MHMSTGKPVLLSTMSTSNKELPVLVKHDNGVVIVRSITLQSNRLMQLCKAAHGTSSEKSIDRLVQ